MKQYMINREVLDEWKRVTGRSDSEIARSIAVPEPSLSRWKNGKRPLPLEAALELERVTQIPLKRLITERTVAAPNHSASEQAAAHAVAEAGRAKRQAKAS